MALTIKRGKSKAAARIRRQVRGRLGGEPTAAQPRLEADREDPLGQPGDLEGAHVPGTAGLVERAEGPVHCRGVRGRQGGERGDPVDVAPGEAPRHPAAPVMPDDMRAVDLRGVEQGHDVPDELGHHIGRSARGPRPGGVAALVRGQSAQARVVEQGADALP